MTKSKYIKSPLNYTGGKYKLLDKIIPTFPQGNGNFVDLFAGGLNVGINVQANTIYANDSLDYLIEIYDYFQRTPVEEIIRGVNDLIQTYFLDDKNKDAYIKFRADYNSNKSPLKLFVLICYSFNHHIRFNNSYEFNMPFGRNRSRYNSNIENNLIQFSAALKEKNIVLSNCNFTDFDFDQVGPGAVVYCDPPYLISTATYNERRNDTQGWGQEEDHALFKLLDDLNDRGKYFALSNVFYHKGLSNNELIRWSEKYYVTYLDADYSNCAYNLKDKTTKSVEVLVTNYEIQ